MSDRESDGSDDDAPCAGQEEARPVPVPTQASSSSNDSFQGATDARRKAHIASLAEPVPIGRNKGRGRGTTSDKQRQQQRATPRSSTIPRAPPSAVRPDANGALPVVNGHSCTDLPESYTEDERALNLFTKLHPMLSLESTSQRALQLTANLIGDSAIPTREVPIVSRSHDNLFLRPADERLGERPCCLGERCICRFVAMMRYGEDTELAFIGREFLLPDEQQAFLSKGTLPAQQGKCLLCSRYMHTYIFRLARVNPAFNSASPMPIQAFGNVLTTATGDDLPTHASTVGCEDGYPQSAILACDSDFAQSDASRSPMGTFQWKPVVAFHSSHYHYEMGTDGIPRITQHFQRPAVRSEVSLPACTTQLRKPQP